MQVFQNVIAASGRRDKAVQQWLKRSRDDAYSFEDLMETPRALVTHSQKMAAGLTERSASRKNISA